NRDWHNNPDTEKENIKKLRDITYEEAEEQMKKGNPFVLRILSDGDPDKKTPFADLIKGKLEVPENDEDFVLLKSDGIPTYHFAHAVDDHLMGTTHVIRGEEWLPSLAKHIQLFRYLNFKTPKYMHIAQLMKMEGNSKKKLSKRDNGAAVSDYRENGYPPVSVNEYVMTLLNSNFEEWRMANPEKAYTEFPFSIKKMSTSGALFDFDKLNDVSKNAISRMTADEVYAGVFEWASEYDKDFAELLSSDAEYAKRILAIGRSGKKPRKDFAVWKDVKPYMSYFYDGLFEKEAEIDEKFDKADVKAVFEKFAEVYDENDDNNAWFEKIKNISESLGYTSDMKAYKQNPDGFKGNVGDVSGFIRIAITGRVNSPDLHEIMRILGKERVLDRLNKAAEAL
ncbi:MAG: glutamate--tRNA ligase, partial [Ruminococcaceae bacterium]|nr:glutamate--tRNA ligase [Oscillospiraceae bacterium]